MDIIKQALQSVNMLSSSDEIFGKEIIICVATGKKALTDQLY